MRNRATLIFLSVVLAALLPFAWSIAQPFFTPFLLACVLGVMIHPLQTKIAVKVRRPGPAALLSTLAALLLLVVPLAFVGFALTRELREAYAKLSRLSVEGGGWQALFSHTTDRAIATAAQYVPIDQDQIRTEVLTHIKDAAGSMLNMAGAAFGGVTSTLVTAVGVLVLLYFVLRYGQFWLDEATSFLPLEPETTASIFRTVNDTVVANVNGLLAVAAGQGFLLGISFAFLGLSSPVLWGLIGAFASMIPVVGIVLVWLPFVIGLAATGSYGSAAMLLGWSVVVVGSADNIIRPLVVRGRVDQNPMLIVLSIIGGTAAFGAIGLILGPVVVSLVIALATELRRRLSHEVANQTP
jgi:predicted PurR-regulated permease PerM